MTLKSLSMKRSTPHQEQQGFLTIAQNGDVDYLRMAYAQAMSIKLTMPGSKYAVIVDEKTHGLVTEQHRKVFDYVIEFPEDHAKDDAWKLRNEWQVFWLTPFKETIKLEADLLIPRSIAHWWHLYRLRDVVLSTGCKNFMGQPATSRKYRRVFDINHLPDTYSGLMYFRYSAPATRFFSLAKEITLNWETIRDGALMECSDANPTTDMVYALASRIMGEELTTLPTADFINFVHMKPAINGWSEDLEYSTCLPIVVDVPHIRINNVQQYHPVHYYEPSFLTDDIVSQYERALGIS
jgi:hypothetical protein